MQVRAFNCCKDTVEAKSNPSRAAACTPTRYIPALHYLNAQHQTQAGPRVERWITSPLSHWLALNKSSSAPSTQAHLLESLPVGMRYGPRRRIGRGDNVIWPIFSQAGRGQEELEGARSAFQRWTGEQMEAGRVAAAVQVKVQQVNRLTLLKPERTDTEPQSR